MIELFEMKGYSGPELRSQKDDKLAKNHFCLICRKFVTIYGPKIWNIIPKEYKVLDTLDELELL